MSRALNMPKNWRRRVLQLLKGAALLVIGAVLGAWMPKVFQDEAKVVAYYRGGGESLRGGRQWTVEVKRLPLESHPPHLPYWIGPFQITNEGDATTPKDLVASLDCSSPFQAYGDPGHAPTDPRPIWLLNPAEAYPMLGPGHPAIYRYMKRHGAIGPGESTILYGFWLNPSEREVRCKLIVTSGTKKPTTIDLMFKFKDYQEV